MLSSYREDLKTTWTKFFANKFLKFKQKKRWFASVMKLIQLHKSFKLKAQVGANNQSKSILFKLSIHKQVKRIK